jgi:DNA-binding transcriptional LysR family regulator
MDWQRLKTFYWVAKAGSFRQASDDRNLSAAALSRQIALLEQDLKVKLFLRHARGLRLTEMGETLFEAARNVYAETRKAETLLDSARGKPQGELRVTTSPSFGTGWLSPRLAEFASRYPDIRIELLISDADLDIAMREADVAIRFVSVERQELVRKRLAKIRFHAWATPSYLQTFGTPERAEDLDKHRLIAYIRPASADYRAYNWPLWAGRSSKGARPARFKNR